MVALRLFLPLADIGQVHGAAGPGTLQRDRRSLLPGSTKRPVPRDTGRRLRPSYTGTAPGCAQALLRRTPGTRGGGRAAAPGSRGANGDPSPQRCLLGGARPPGARVGTRPAPGEAPAPRPSRRGERGLPQGRGGGGPAGPQGEAEGVCPPGYRPPAKCRGVRVSLSLGGSRSLSREGGAAPLTGPRHLPPRTRTPPRSCGLPAARLRPTPRTQAPPRTARAGGPQRWEGGELGGEVPVSGADLHGGLPRTHRGKNTKYNI